MKACVTMGGRVVDQTAVPLTGRKVDHNSIAADPQLSALLVSVLVTLRQASESLEHGADGSA